MPSHINAAAFILLSSFSDECEADSDSDSVSDSDSEEDSPKVEDRTPYPWGWPHWQKITGISQNPFGRAPIPNSPFDWKTQDEIDAVLAFRLNFLALSGLQQLQYIRGDLVDSDSRGRALWRGWIIPQLKRWKLNGIVDAAMSTHNYHPFSIMKRLKTQKVCIVMSLPD